MVLTHLSTEQSEQRWSLIVQAWTHMPLLCMLWANHGQAEWRGTLILPTFSNLLQRFPSLSTHFAEGLKDAPEHVLGNIAVQGAHTEAHWSTNAFLQVVGHGCQSVFLSLRKEGMMGQVPHLLPSKLFSRVSSSACSPVRPVQWLVPPAAAAQSTQWPVAQTGFHRIPHRQCP